MVQEPSELTAAWLPAWPMEPLLAWIWLVFAPALGSVLASEWGPVLVEAAVLELDRADRLRLGPGLSSATESWSSCKAVL